MNCPHCKAPMLVVEYDGVELDHCAACEGTWFDQGELDLLLFDEGDPASEHVRPETIAALPAAASDEAARRCPLCRKAMRKVNIGLQGRVLIDVCPRGHGLWFDRGELADLATELTATGEDLPDRALRFLGGVIRPDGAAPSTEET